MPGIIDNANGRSSSPRPRPWTAADSDKCEHVLEVMSDDVLLGRGSGPNDHVGNIKFRDLVHERKAEYLSTNHRQTKAQIAKDIVDIVYGRGGRFLKKLTSSEAEEALPKLLKKLGIDDAENDRSDPDKPTRDVYQIQKHTTVMEKAKQALRQNQRNEANNAQVSSGIQSPGSAESAARRDSTGRNSNKSFESSNGGNWNGVSMGNMGGSFNDSPQFHRNIRDSFELGNSNFSNSPNQGSYRQQLLQQQQNLLELQQQHDMLQMQFQQQRQRQHQQQQQQRHQMLTQQQQEMETQQKLLQEQLELQIREEQLRQRQEQLRNLQNLANNQAMFSDRQRERQPEPNHTPSQSSPPAMLNGYATYTTTLDAIEDNRNNHTDGLAEPHYYKGDEKHPDDKSMEMSTMMGSFKDMSVKDGEERSVHGSSGDTIGTIEGVGIPAGFGSNMHMSGISMMSMMNDSTDSLFKNPQKAGNDVGAKNASWGNNSGILADVVESNPNPAAVAAAAVLGKSVPTFEKAQRRWSGGFIPAEAPPQRRINRRGSLQYTSNNVTDHSASQDLNQMQATASAMLAMAQADHERQQQSFNYRNMPNEMGYGGHEMMNQNSQGYHMDGMNNGYRN